MQMPTMKGVLGELTGIATANRRAQSCVRVLEIEK